MHWVDWGIVAGFCLVSFGLGIAMRGRGGASLEAYFVSNRALGWWLAGTSMAATAFSSDTPLLITGMVRRRGIWGVWEVWALGIGTMLTVFVFAKLWKRANIVTEVELVERRYSGTAAAFLRGFKAIYWGLLYNCFIIGVWVVTGMTKVLQETTGFHREGIIIACVLLGTAYTSISGLWGVVLTDLFQFVWAMIGAVVLAVAAVNAVGGLSALSAQLRETPALAMFPPADPSVGLLDSPVGWFLGLILMQWWAWKNSDGGGIIVQRLVSCKNERHAMGSVLWFNIAHYALRSWPWILAALASLILIPDDTIMSTIGGQTFVDHERAYPRLITTLLPVGLRGILIAAFFAAFLSTLSTQLNWGASYLVYDGYRRFVNRHAEERHYVRVARLTPWLLALGGMLVAFFNRTIGESFTLILNLTAGIGPVYLLRWLWWRVNAWSEIAAMSASVPLVLLLSTGVLGGLGWPTGRLMDLVFMVGGSALVWLPVTLLTPPVDRGILKQFYAAVRPPGWWKPVAVAGMGSPAAASDGGWGRSVVQWLLGTAALLATTLGPLELMVGSALSGALWCGAATVGWTGVWWTLRARRAHAD